MTTSVYIHIPFCHNICNYCDFAKIYYRNDIANNYLEALKKEIKDNYKGELLKTIYIGGGSPSSLSINNLSYLMKIIKIFKFDKKYEFTFEMNPEDIDYEKLILLKENGVNRISIGVESTSNKYLKYLNRKHDYSLVKEKIKLVKLVGFTNISLDLIYGMKNEKITDLKKDLYNIVKLDVNHISLYSLEIHSHTIFGIRNEERIVDDIDRSMYDYICNYLKDNGYNHYEISNFCRKDMRSSHNIVYWKNLNYYGFGLGASGYVGNVRYQNTRSMHNYTLGNRIIYKEDVSLKDKISYELILGFRLIDGINKKDFKNKYGIDIRNLYNISDLINEGYLIENEKNIKINEEFLYVENNILENFVES